MGDEWQVKTFPHEAIFDFFEMYLGGVHVGQTQPVTSTVESGIDEISQQQELAESENIKKTDPVAVAPLTEGLTLDVYKHFDEGLRQFNEFLARHKSLRVMCLEITLTPQEATIGKKWRALHRKRIELLGCFDLLVERYGLLAEYSRIEIGINSSLVLQWVLLFKGHAQLDSRKIRATIQQDLESQMASDSHWETQSFKVGVQDLGRLYHSLDPRYNEVIKARSGLARRAFEYWVLGYFYRVDSFLKPDLVRLVDSIYVDKHLEHPVSLWPIKGASIHGQEVKLRQYQIKESFERIDNFIDLDFSPESKQIWKNNNLPKQAKDDLKLLGLLYLQYKDRLPVDGDREKESCLKILLSIEHFMRLIQYNPVQALIEEYLPRGQFEKSPLKCLSQQAKQYLHIGKQLKQLGLSLTEIADLAFVGWRVREFLRLFKDNPWGFKISRYGRADLEFCLDRFKNLEHYQVGDLKGGPSLFDIEKQEAVSVKRNQAKAKDYLNKAITQDVFAFRLEFSYQPNEAFTSAKNITAFNALLTDFLKNLKRTRKISGESLVAYVGTRMFIGSTLTADITLIFSAQNLSDYDEQKNKECIKQSSAKVIGYWRDYISIKERKISKNKKASTETRPDYLNLFRNENLRISQSAIISSLPKSSNLIHIKQHDSKKLRSFKSELADFYSGHGLLCKWKFDMLENLKPSEESDRSKNIDQFLKGHVVLDKPKQLKPKKEAVQNEIKVEAENSTEAEAISKKELPIAIEGEAILNTIPTAQNYVQTPNVLIKRRTKAVIPKS